MRLPRNQSEGNIPKIALTTGGADRLECLLRKIGIDGQRVHARGRHRAGELLRRGNAIGATIRPPTSLRGHPERRRGLHAGDHLLERARQPSKRYDMVMLSCEGNQYPEDKSPAARAALVGLRQPGRPRVRLALAQHLAAGGPPPWPTVANFDRHGQTCRRPLHCDGRHLVPQGRGPGRLAGERGRLDDARASSPIQEGKHTVTAVNPTLLHPLDPQPDGRAAAACSTSPSTPRRAMAAGMECGRMVFTDIHVSAGRRHGRPALPHRLRDHRAVPPGEGPGVHAVRPVVLRSARRQAAGHPLSSNAWDRRVLVTR